VVVQIHTTGDIVGCFTDSNAGSLTWYRNNVLLGTSTTAVIGDA
jgi:glycerol-3-phosphate O-acyltransferase